MKRWRPALWALGLLLIVAAAAAAWRLRAPQVDLVTLGTAPLVRTLQFSARVATTSRVSVGLMSFFVSVMSLISWIQTLVFHVSTSVCTPA